MTASATLQRVEPVCIGPTWERDADHPSGWRLPELTLGWHVIAWQEGRLRHRGDPWRYTPEQLRLLLWWYAVDDQLRFVFRDGVVQRLKGWGKDPFGSTICATEFVGPCRPDRSGRTVHDPWGREHPAGVRHLDAWVQTAAVSKDQTRNTMTLFPGLFSPAVLKEHSIDLGKEIIYGSKGAQRIEAVTSSPRSLEGARATFVLRNETHHWIATNEGHEMDAVIDRNATKSHDGSARALSITNAYEPGEDSVAQRAREAWESMRAGRTVDTGMLYDSVEAPPDAPLTAEAAPSVVDAIRGDSSWLDVDRIVQAILDPRNPPSASRRFWYNQITATEDAWVTPQEWDTAADPELVVAKGAAITLGFDGSISDDHCALIGCDVETDHLFELGVWEPVKATGEVDRAEIDRTVRTTFETYDVVGFYGDLHPFESYIDRWAEDFGDDLLVKATPRQPIAWDIRARGQQFTAAIERLHDAIVESALEKTTALTEAREIGQRLTHCGAQRSRQHFHNARRAPNRWGISVRKEHRESSRKIDSVPAAALARLARADYLALSPSRRTRKGRRSGLVIGLR